jgi:hypothetical protein
MSKLLLTIIDENKASLLLEFLKSLNYINVSMVEDDYMPLNSEQKSVLDERRLSFNESDFQDWDIAKHKLRFNK